MVKMTSCTREFKDHVTSLCNLNDRESALAVMLAVDMASPPGGPTQTPVAPPGSTRRSDPDAGKRWRAAAAEGAGPMQAQNKDTRL